MDTENQDKLIRLAEGKSFGLRLMKRMKQYVDDTIQEEDAFHLATDAQIRAIIDGSYEEDADVAENEATDAEIDELIDGIFGGQYNEDPDTTEEATEDDINNLINGIFN